MEDFLSEADDFEDLDISRVIDVSRGFIVVVQEFRDGSPMPAHYLRRVRGDFDMLLRVVARYCEDVGE